MTLPFYYYITIFFDSLHKHARIVHRHTQIKKEMLKSQILIDELEWLLSASHTLSIIIWWNNFNSLERIDVIVQAISCKFQASLWAAQSNICDKMFYSLVAIWQQKFFFFATSKEWRKKNLVKTFLFKQSEFFSIERNERRK